MDQETRYTRVCPNCGNKLGFSSNQETVHCQCCESDFSRDELLKSNQTSSTLSATFAQENIDSNESGLAYLDSVFAVLDWDDFCTNNPTLFVESVTAVVEKMKVKFANQPQTWLFEFKSISLPLKKRFEFMDKTLDEIAGKDADLEDESLLSKFDCYCLSVELLLKGKEFIKKALEVDLSMMKKFKLDAVSLKACEVEHQSLIKALDDVKETVSVYDLEVVKKKTKAKEDEIVKKYKAQGIEVTQVYERAIKSYLFGDKTSALKDFESIREYRDSVKYIGKLKFDDFIFDQKFIEIAGVTYIVRPNSADKTPTGEKKGCSFLNKKGKPIQSVTQTFVSKNLFELRPLIDGVAGDTPIVKNIESVVMAYGDMLYYVDGDNNLVVFNFTTKTINHLISLKECDISPKALCRYPSIGKFIFLAPNEKSVSKTGCFKKKAKKGNEEQPVAQIARYRIAVVDCYNASVSFHDSDILCITDVFSKRVFYTKGIFKDNGILEKKMYYVFDVASGKSICPFNREVFIYNVVDDHIIYGLWQPNGLNIDLYSYNLETTKVTLLEKNAYDIAYEGSGDDKYPLSIDGFVYYLIGNEEFAPLYRIKPDGSDRKEIMPNVERINFIRNGYFYITRVHRYRFGDKWRYYKTLIKSKTDGSSMTYVCSGFSYIVCFKQGYIYYVDSFNKLHIVRADGEQDRVISDHFDEELLINEKNIFFLYEEQVNGREYGKSIYVMDLQGKNLHKIAFDVVEAEYYDENTIYYSVDDVLSYEVKTPKDKVSYNEPVIKDYNVRMYYALNVNDLHLTRIFVDGLPKFDKGGEQKGCKLFNKPTLPIIATQVEHIYPMPEKTKVSYIEQEEQKKDNGGTSTNKNKNNVGCGKAGCAPKKGRK